MTYRNKTCGLIQLQATYKAPESEPEQSEAQKKKQAEEKLKKLFDGPEEISPASYIDCTNKKNDSCYFKDNGIKKFDFCITCAQDKFRWQDQANKWGNFIIKQKQGNDTMAQGR